MTLLEARLRLYDLSLRSYKKVAHHKKSKKSISGGPGPPLCTPYLGGYQVKHPKEHSPPPSRTTSMPKSIAIHLAVWISTENRQTHGLVNSQTCLTPSEACICVNHKYKPRPKIKNPLSHVCSAHQMLSKMVRHSPLAPKTMEEMHF